ncbi:MAG TPA: hypothetical protein VFE98_01190 [Candidatus Bathyarchaeia archaeon]|nr:hypothetical protein [Candidatus Bathyarchaeia archaeon]
MFHEIIPLKVKLEDIEHVDSDNMGRIRIKVPARRDIHIPLDHEESNKLLEKLDEGFPYARKPAGKSLAKTLSVTPCTNGE